MCEYLLESCVESLEQAFHAFNHGAKRIELCADLKNDGLTPSLTLFNTIKKSVPTPIKVMIRPRSGNFEYNPDEINQIYSSIDDFKDAGARFIVFGAIKNFRLDIDLIRKVASYAHPMKITIHKAIDESTSLYEDIELLKTIPNVNSILSSGGSEHAIHAIDTLKKICLYCADDINLIVAGKVTQKNIETLATKTGAKEFHGRKIV